MHALLVALATATTASQQPSLRMWGLAGSAFFILVFLALFAPALIRRRLRVPLTLLISWGVATIVWSIPEISPGLREWCEIVSLVTLGLASVRLLWILAVDWGLRQGSTLGVSRISRDLVQGVLYIVTAIAAARAAGADAQALATTGGLVTAGLTFSLQQTLGDLVAGLLLQAEAPFKVGDWIAYDEDPAHNGRVIEINWRATKIVTIEMVELTVPNSILAKSAITNFHEPSLPAERCVQFGASYASPPRLVQRVAAAAVPGTDGVLESPEPYVTVGEFADSAVTYVVRYFVKDHAQRNRIDSDVRVRLWYALRRAGIEIVFPRTDIALVDEASARERAEAAERDHRVKSFEKVDFLAPLSSEERMLLARNARTEWFVAGERVVAEGDHSTELYIVSEGELSVRANGGREIARIGAGGFFGEMALLTGEPRSASVVAIGDCALCVVDKETFEPVLNGHRGLFEQISQIVATRQDEAAHRRGDGAGNGEDLAARQVGLLDRMRRFFARDEA